jgi:hypothetical protein
VDLQNVSPATFASEIGTEFKLAGDEQPPVALVLDAVELLPVQPGAPRAEPFSLVFVGPGQPQLEQRTHALVHSSLGLLEIFLVPIGHDDAGRLRYEAVFN